MVNQKERARIHALRESHQELSALCKLCQKQKIPIYLTGGALRDTISESGQPSDLDLYLECSPEFGKSLRTEALKRVAESPEESRLPRIESTFCHSVTEKLIRFDFTLNALAFDLVNGDVLDPSGRALQDIRSKELHPVSSQVFLTSPKSQIRLFRFALQREYIIPESTLSLLHRHGSIVGTANLTEEALTFSQILALFSTQVLTVDPLKLLCTSRVLELTLPESAPLKPQEHPEEVVRILKDCDHYLDSFPNHLREQFDEVREQVVRIAGKQEAKVSSFNWSLRGVVRLFTLLCASYDAFLSVPSTVDLFSSPEARAKGLRNYFSNLSSRLSASTILSRTVSQLVLAGEVYEQFRSGIKLGNPGDLSKLPVRDLLPGITAAWSLNDEALRLSASDSIAQISSKAPQLLELSKW